MLPLVLNPLKPEGRPGRPGRGLGAPRSAAGRGGVEARLLSADASDEVLAPLQLLFVAGLAEGEARQLAARARGWACWSMSRMCPPLCDFHVPAIVRRGDLLLTASTGGTVPGLARRCANGWRAASGRNGRGRLAESGRGPGPAGAPGPVARRSLPKGARPGRRKRAGCEHATVIDAASIRAHRARPAANDPQLAHLAAAGKGAGPRCAWHSGTGADRRIRRPRPRWSRPSARNPRCCCIWWRRSIPPRRSCSSTPASCSAKPCAIATAAGRAGSRRCPQPCAGSAKPRSKLDPEGTLWSRDADACCNFRKVVPLAARWSRSPPRSPAASASRPASAPRCSRWNISRAASASIRSGNGPQAELEAYAETHKLPRASAGRGRLSLHRLHALHPPGRRGEDYRAGRWAGLDKDECGIHIGVDGEGI